MQALKFPPLSRDPPGCNAHHQVAGSRGGERLFEDAEQFNVCQQVYCRHIVDV